MFWLLVQEWLILIALLRCQPTCSSAYVYSGDLASRIFVSVLIILITCLSTCTVRVRVVIQRMTKLDRGNFTLIIYRYRVIISMIHHAFDSRAKLNKASGHLHGRSLL